MNEKIELLLEKFILLKNLDKGFQIFGASNHKYIFNEKLSENEILEFESKYSIRLPSEYRDFLKYIGNGGAGPYYGLQTLSHSLYADLDYKRLGELVNPTLPFPLIEAWNMEFNGAPEDEEAYEKFSEEYFSEQWDTGILRICNFGCGVSLNLVVNGPEAGNIWVDDRGNDGGIYPDPYFGQTGKTSFSKWYEMWLDRSLSELQNED